MKTIMMFKKRGLESLVLGEKDKNEKRFRKTLTRNAIFSIMIA